MAKYNPLVCILVWDHLNREAVINLNSKMVVCRFLRRYECLHINNKQKVSLTGVSEYWLNVSAFILVAIHYIKKKKITLVHTVEKCKTLKHVQLSLLFLKHKFLCKLKICLLARRCYKQRAKYLTDPTVRLWVTPQSEQLPCQVLNVPAVFPPMTIQQGSSHTQSSNPQTRSHFHCQKTLWIKDWSLILAIAELTAGHRKSGRIKKLHSKEKLFLEQNYIRNSAAAPPCTPLGTGICDILLTFNLKPNKSKLVSSNYFPKAHYWHFKQNKSFITN